MSESSWVAVLSLAVTSLIGLVGYLVTRRGAKESHEVEERRADIEGLSKAVDALKTALAAVEERVSRVEDERDIAVCDRDLEREYVRLLIEHINEELGPPPPERPQRRSR